MSGIKLSVVIVNYNGGELALTCLASLFENQPSFPFEVLVVDNQSIDDSAAQIASRFTDVRLLQMGTNAGLSKAYNRGITASSGEHILLLDNDTIVLPGALDAMIEFLDETPEACGCGAKLVNPDGSSQRTARRFPHPLNGVFGRGSLLTKWFPGNPISRRYLMSDSENSDVPYEVDTLSTACMMVRRSSIANVGLMDEDYFVYWCDTDWCYRIKQAGWKIYSLPGATIIHNENSRFRHRKGRRIRRIVDFHQGVYRYYRKHYVRSAWSPMNMLAIMGLTVRAALLIAIDEISRLFPKPQI